VRISHWPPTQDEIRAAIAETISRFPFAGYMEARSDAHQSIVANCVRLLQPGARVLDYGAGPCDTTAILARLGFQCCAVDDLSDDWHQLGRNRVLIEDFAAQSRVGLTVAGNVPAALAADAFDMVMIHDVIEHIADSPRALLVRLIDLIRPGGYLYISVPNAVNLRKRLLVLSGKTNYPRFPAYFWSGDHWRGHKREYVKDDLAQLCEFLGVKRIILRGEHHRLTLLPPPLRGIYRATLGRIDSLRETLALIARRAQDWSPPEISPTRLRQIRQREAPYQYGDEEQTEQIASA
jgi:2-polyprenyl-3-methyl-5-hydroxy-6-metoxy-1,4-benzoquinol methylase